MGKEMFGQGGGDAFGNLEGYCWGARGYFCAHCGAVTDRMALKTNAEGLPVYLWFSIVYKGFVLPTALLMKKELGYWL
jgi:hypothetical protein